MAFESISQLTMQSRPATFPSFVYRHGKLACDWAGFCRSVATVRQKVSHSGYSRWVIASEDVLSFSVYLLAVLQVGHEVLLPRNMTESARSEIMDARTGVLSGLVSADVDPNLDLDFPAIDPNAATLRLYTSGSSGEPKEAVKKLRQIEAELRNLYDLWGKDCQGRTFYTTVQHHHFYGLLFYVLLPLCGGFPVCVDMINYPEGLVDLQDQAVVIVGSPAFYKRFVEAALPVLRFSTPVALFSSGGNLPQAISTQVQARTAAQVWEIYGSTETGGIAWRNGPDQTTWQAFAGISLRVDDQSCIAITSPYLPDYDWYTTSDQGTILPDGTLNLAGRIDSVVKIEEKRVSLTEVERRLRESPLVAEARVIALEDGRQYLAAVLVLSQAGHTWMEGQTKLSANQHFRNWLRTWFEATVLPRKWRFVDTLPQDSMGKVALSALKALFAPQAEAPTKNPGGVIIDQVQKTADQLIVDFHVPPDSIWFQGHFPAFPILPGVVQIDWLMHCVSHFLNLQADLRSIPRLKFMKPILPNMNMRLDCSVQREHLQISYKYLSVADLDIFSSGKLNLVARK